MIGTGVALFLFWSYQLGPVPIGATLLFLYVPFTQAMNLVITGRPPPLREIESMVLVLAGAALVANFFGTVSRETLRGASQAVLAALCFAGFFVVTSRLAGRSTPIFLSFFFAAGWPLLTPAVMVPKTLLWLGLMGVCGQVIPVFLLVRKGPKTGELPGLHPDFQ